MIKAIAYTTNYERDINLNVFKIYTHCRFTRETLNSKFYLKPTLYNESTILILTL